MRTISSHCIVSLTILLGATSVSVAQQQQQFMAAGRVTINTTVDSNNVPIFTPVLFNSQNPPITPPLVFAFPTDEGISTPCDIRIKNVTTTGFEAYCVEPTEIDFDGLDGISGVHEAMDMHYIAFSPGVHNIPVNGGGTHRIIAGSFQTDDAIGTRQCTGCDTNSTAQVTYPVAFDARPSLITQIQTMNNESNHPPAILVNGSIEERPSQPFLSSNQSNQSATGFEYNLERSQASEGSVTTTETVAYLASDLTRNSAGTPQCVDLNLTSLRGPASVPFQALNTGNIARASGFGCPDNTRLDFAPAGCFNNASDVVAVGDTTTRNGPDGRWIYRCDNNFPLNTAITVGINEEQSVDAERDHVRESFDVMAFGVAFTNPVTLNYFRSHLVAKNRIMSNGTELNKDDLIVRWQSLSEEENIGYNLWAKVRGKWRIINRDLIDANTQGTFSASQVYRHIIPAKTVTRFRINESTPLGLTSISTSAEEEFFGPYTVGKHFGSLMESKPIDWAEIRAAYNKTMDKRGYVYLNNRFVAKRILSNNDSDGVLLSFDKAGMARVSYQAIKDAGLDLEDVQIRDIAISHQGKPVRRFINSANNSRFTSASSIEFFAQPIDAADGLYEKTNRYRISINRHLARPMRERSILNRQRGKTTDQLAQVKASLEEDKAYIITSRKPHDPFMMDQIYALNGQQNQLTYSLDVPALNSEDTRMTLRLNNLIEAVESRWKVSVNDDVVFDNKAVSQPYEDITFDVAPEHFVVGENTIKIELINDANAPILFSAIDSISISQLEKLVATQTQGLHWVSDNDDARFFEVAANHANNIDHYYAINQRDIAFRIALTRNSSSPTDKVFIRNYGKGTQYFIGDHETMLAPSYIEPFEAINDNHLFTQADYLIIANPIFAQSAELDNFVNHKTLMGHQVHVAKTDDIFQKFSDGLELPSAIKQYIRFFNNQSALKNVLLIGGDTYDYHNNVSNSMSFVPSFYTHDETGNQFVPSDVIYADLDNNGIEDFSIGRWPLRKLSELADMVDKSIEYELAVNNGGLNDALLISDVNDNQNINYKSSVTSFVNYQPTNLNTQFVHAQDGVDANESQSQIRQRIIDAASSKVRSTIYNGHSSPSRWSFNNLLDVNNIKDLDDSGSLGMVMPLACYTTYTQSPTGNSLGYKLMAEKGAAVTLHGPAMVSSYSKNSIFGQGVQLNLREGKSIGEAIRSTKKTQTARSLKYHWILLGDPSLKMIP